MGCVYINILEQEKIAGLHLSDAKFQRDNLKGGENYSDRYKVGKNVGILSVYRFSWKMNG